MLFMLCLMPMSLSIVVFDRRCCHDADCAAADVPKAMLGAAVVRDAARPDWPEGSSCMQAAAFAAVAAAAAGLPGGADLEHPPMHYRQLTEACWAQNPADRCVYPVFRVCFLRSLCLVARWC